MSGDKEKAGKRCKIEEQAGWPIPTLRRCLLDENHKGDCIFPEVGEEKRFPQSGIPAIVRISEKIKK